MKMNKKMLSLTLALVMILGSMTAVFGQELNTEAKAGEFLESVGVLIGGDDGDLMLKDKLTRRDSVILISRLLGEEDEAKSYKVGKYPTFKDVQEATYYKNYIGWAEDNGYYQGGDEQNFYPLGTITGRDYALVLLRVMGYRDYDDAGVGAFQEAKELGLLENLKNVDAGTKINRGQMALMTVNALSTKMKGSDETLADKLGIKMPEEGEEVVDTEVKEVKSVEQDVLVDEENVELVFEVNGKEYTLEEFNKVFNKDDKYEVEFFTNNKDAEIKDGKLVKAVKSFKYSVGITNTETEEVMPEKPKLYVNFSDINVKTNRLAVVTKVGLGNKLNYITKDMSEEERQIQVLEGVTELGDLVDFTAEDNKVEQPEVKSIKSSNSTVAYVEGLEIVPVREGKTTLTIEFEGIRDSVEFDIEVRADRKVTSIEAEDQKVATNTKIEDLDFKLLDQYGGELDKTTGELKYEIKGKEVTTLDQKGKHTVTVKSGDKILGTIKVEVVEIDSNTSPDEYVLVLPEEDKDLDIKKDGNKTVKIEVVAKVDGVVVPVDELKNNKDLRFDVGLNNDQVEVAAKSGDHKPVFYEDGKAYIEVNLKDKSEKVGSVDVQLYVTENDMKIPVDKTIVEIVNTTEQVVEVDLKDDVEKLEVEVNTDDLDKLDLFYNSKDEGKIAEEILNKLAFKLDDKDVEAKDLSEYVKKDPENDARYEGVRFIERQVSEDKNTATGKVQIEIAPEYGGMIFEFDITVTKAAASESNTD